MILPSYNSNNNNNKICVAVCFKVNVKLLSFLQQFVLLTTAVLFSTPTPTLQFCVPGLHLVRCFSFASGIWHASLFIAGYPCCWLYISIKSTEAWYSGPLWIFLGLSISLSSLQIVGHRSSFSLMGYLFINFTMSSRLQLDFYMIKLWIIIFINVFIAKSEFTK